MGHAMLKIHRPDQGVPASVHETALWGQTSFRMYLTGQTVSVVGSSTGQIAMPLVAVTQLGATIGQVSLLMFVGQLSQALLALHAGAWAERTSKRRQMITGDLVGALAIVSVPLSAAFDTLTMAQLMAVAIVQGGATVTRDAAAISYLPTLIDRSRIQQANSLTGAVRAVAATLGHVLGATLISLLGPARALSMEALSHLINAWCTRRINCADSDTPPSPSGRLLNEIVAGVRYVRNEDTLRTLTLLNAGLVFALGVSSTLWVLHLLHLGFGALALGFVMGVGALGAAAGALLSPRLTTRFGSRTMMLAALALAPLTQIPFLIAGPEPMWQIAIGLALFLQQACTNLVGITQRSIRQCVAAADQQARMQGVNTILTTGSRPPAALLAGALGTWVGIHATLVVGAVLLILPLLILFRSPLRWPQMPGATLRL